MPPKRQSKVSNPQRALLSDGPAYAGQQKVVLRLPGTTALLSTTVTTGVIANTSSFGFDATQGFATRFGSTFDEARLLAVTCNIRPISNSTGISVFMWDEKSSSAPTSTDAFERVGLRLPNTNANPKSFTSMTWRARDLVDLEYSPIGSGPDVVFFKVYTDAANFGAPATVTALWQVEFILTVEFRGIKAAA